MAQRPFLSKLRSIFHQFRYSISYIDALPQLTLLGLLVGLMTGLIIIVFRLCIDIPLAYFLSEGSDDFEHLAAQSRIALIIGGTLVLYAVLKAAGKNNQVSVSHVLDRLHNHQGHMPSRNWFVQFIGGVVSLVSGQSVGREGPAVHLGAGAASRIGRALRLPNNSRHTLIACGVAAAIAASFDTPLAGVIFAMEVILMEYTIVGFVPVILASVTGAALNRLVFASSTPLLSYHAGSMQSLLELPYLVGVGLVLACAAACFIAINLRSIKCTHWPLSLRLLLVGLLTAIFAWYVPAVMGLGYDTVNAALAGELSARTLFTIALAKLTLSATVIGLGVPGGVIGPTLVVGACIGGCMGFVAQQLYQSADFEPGFYVIIGMTGMMAAVLNAPMAALIAVLELSYNPHMIFPSMLVIVVACVSTRAMFKFEGIFLEQLRHSGRAMEFRPALQALKKTGIANVMTTKLAYSHRYVDYEQAKLLLINKPEWIVIDFNEQGTRDKVALNPADLATYLNNASVDVLSLEEDVDLLAIPARRLILSPIHETANLWEALEALRNGHAEALYVARLNNPLTASIRGIITEQAINNYYQV